MAKLSNQKQPAGRSENEFPNLPALQNHLSNPQRDSDLILAKSGGALVSQKKKLDILRTFELFNKENIGILKDKIVEIILVEADNIFAKNKKMFNIDFIKDKSVQISIFNDKRTYDLLSNTWKRHRMKHENLNDENNKSGIFDQLSGH